MKLKCKNVVVHRGEREILRDVSFEVGRGQTVALRGANGSGKTTLLRTIAGFLKPTAGTIDLEGADPERSIGENCHFIGHKNGLKSNLSVFENLTFWARYFDSNCAHSLALSKVRSAAERFELTSLLDIPTRYLSAGQQRRSGLARLLVCNRPLWLLDEPTVSLDTHASDLFKKVVSEHASAGGLAMIATHTSLGLENVREFHVSNGVKTSPGTEESGTS